MNVKRLLSTIMCVFLLLTLLPTVALAAGSVEVDTAEEFANAVDNADIDTINITGSFSLGGLGSAVFINRQVTITSGGTYEIDTTGRSIVIDPSGDVTISGNLRFTGSGTNSKTIIVNGGRLTATGGVEIITTGDNGAAALEVMASGIVNMTGDIIAYGRHSHGVISGDESSQVTVTGDVYASGDLVTAIVVESQSTVEVTGDVTVTDNGSETSGIEYGIEARDGGLAIINGNVTTIGSESCGIYLWGGGSAAINGDVSAVGNYSNAVYAEGYSTAATSATVTGNVSADGEGSTGVYAFMGGVANIGGSVSAQGYNSEAVYAMTTTEGDPPTTVTAITVGEDVSVVGDESCAVSAVDQAGTGATVTVDGNVTASGLESYGIDVWDGGIAIINGDVSAVGLDSYSVATDGAGSNATVTGNVAASGGQNYGIAAGYGGIANIYGHVSVQDEGSCAVYAFVGGTANITGNMTADGDPSCALCAEDTDSVIEVIGNVTAADDYIILNDVPKGVGEGTAGTGVYEHYLIYDDGASAVRIRNTYDITASAGNGGSIEPSGTVAVPRGDSQTFSITADSGCVITSVMVDGTNEGAISSYTFENVSENHTISAIFTSEQPTITTTALPDGTAGSPYSQTLAAGGDTPITWSIDSGSLPAGLMLSSGGAISGTPTASGSFNFTVIAENSEGSDTQALNITISPAPPTTYTVTFSSNGSTYATKTVSEDESIGSANWPSNPTRSGYTFGGWFTGTNGSGTQFTSSTAVNANITVYAKWTPNGGGGSSSGSGSNTPPTQTYNADVKSEGAGTTLPVTVNKDNESASIDIGLQKFTLGGTVITIPSIPGVDIYSVGIPVPELQAPDGQGMLTLNTDTGSVTVPSNMLAGAESADGEKAQITISEGDKSDLPEDVKTAIGTRPLVQITLSIDGNQIDWSNPAAPVTVSIPYTPTEAELNNPESIVVWYIDGAGNVVTILNGRYDPANRTVTFSTTHFSDYAVAYNPVSFNDVAAGAWYNKAVSFIAAREITTGTGNGNYSPEAKLTRGEFIVLMMRAYGIAPDVNPTENFSDAGDTYYTGYLAAAKRLGISNGIGNNMYAPSKEITRQEMFTLLYNALKVIGQLPLGDSGKTLSDFTDIADIASWATEAMTLLVETGTVSGSGGKLIPTGSTSRAEMAQVLYNLLDN